MYRKYIPHHPTVSSHMYRQSHCCGERERREHTDAKPEMA